ncbi:NADH dehydrogenase subunit 2 (mitochondrion) [Macrosteles quadrilineatus]|uniref:NADH-ubiquinone oxidoreductase chain 2 n=1 Tax=Macrosteles quadrilineatus TaxID=74068 RepID=A0A343CXA1_MACQU|nr:NADH dehydrogenase subunit 2 [Macrosteles quadrilineatus]ARQ26983.1 NADH dehydrogenase subunit 2 [Macrosteles quadrilineatus]
MNMNSTMMILLNVMMIGVIMTASSNNWISMWMGIEMSMVSFIPMITNYNNQMSSESMMKYFIIQSIASTMFLFSTISMLIGVNMEIMENLVKLSMIIKLGLAPFHNWVLMIIESMSYFPMFIMLTIMKIQPMIIMFQLNFNKMMTLVILMSMIISSFSALNQSSIRKTLGWSSIYNMSIMMTSTNKLMMSMTYLMIYSLIMMILLKTVMKMKINYLNQMMFNEFSMLIKINMWINMLSMSGFPPTMGFFIKLIMIQNMINENQNMMIMVMVLTSMLVMMFYTRMAFNSMMMFCHMKKWMMISMNKPMYYLMILNLTMMSTMLTMMNFM